MNDGERRAWAERVANDIVSNDHSYRKHCEGLELTQANGQPLTREQYKQLIVQTLMDPRAQGRVSQGSSGENLMIYSHETRMMIVINPRKTQDGSTAYPLSDNPPGEGRRHGQVPENERLARAQANNSVHNGIIYNGGEGLPRKPMDIFRRADPDSKPVSPSEGGVFDSWLSRRENRERLDRYCRPHPHEGSHAANGMHGHIGRAAGVIGVVLGAAAAAGEAAAAEGRNPNAGDYVAGAWNNTVGGALTQGRKMEAVMRLAECIDPSAGMLTGGLRNAARAAGADVDPSVVESVEKLQPEDRRRFQRNCNLLAINARDQLAILQEGGLADICDANGKRLDVGAILRDPTQRKAFMDKLQSSYETMQDPAEKEKLRRMISASNRYCELQEYRQQIIADATSILQKPNSGVRPAPLPQSPMAPIASVGTKSFNFDMTNVSEQMTRATIDKLLDPNSALPCNQSADLNEYRKEDILNPATFLLRAKSETELPAKGSIKEAPKSLPALDTIPL